MMRCSVKTDQEEYVGYLKRMTTLAAKVSLLVFIFVFSKWFVCVCSLTASCAPSCTRSVVSVIESKFALLTHK
jgi:hypothetical protein